MQQHDVALVSIFLVVGTALMSIVLKRMLQRSVEAIEKVPELITQVNRLEKTLERFEEKWEARTKDYNQRLIWLEQRRRP